MHSAGWDKETWQEWVELRQPSRLPMTSLVSLQKEEETSRTTAVTCSTD